MIAVILSWIILMIVFLSFGKMFILLSEKFTGMRGSYSLFDLFFVGLCTVGTIICISSLFIPSGGNVLLFLLIVSFLFWAFGRKSRVAIFERIKGKLVALNSIQYILIAIIFTILLSFVVMPPQLPDSFYYHIQNMMWNEEYRVVPGLANLIEQFGFNSNFFLLSSVFGLKPLFGQFIYSINALCYGVLIVYFIVSYHKTKQRRIIALLGLVVCFVYFLVYKIHIASPSTDMLPNILIVYLLFNILGNTKNITQKNILFWMVPIYCLTLKLSSIFLCLFVLLLVTSFVRNKSYKALAYLCFIALSITIPWFIRNIIVSGYLIYPFPEVDLFDVDWKMPIQYVVASKKYVEAYAISVDALHYSSDYVLNLPFSEKLSRWLTEQPLYELLIVVVALLSPLLMSLAYWRNKLDLKKSVIWWTWSIAFLGFAFGLIMAPAIRFGFGFIVMASSIPIYYILLRIKFIDWLFTSRMLLMFSITVLLIVGALSTRYVMSVHDPDKPIYHTLCKPLGLDSTRPGREQKITIVKVNNLYINKASGLPMDAPLPCSSVYINNIEMRGSSLQDGFRVKKIRSYL